MLFKLLNMIHFSVVDGEGTRIVWFMQGCPHNCKGCKYPDMANNDDVPHTSITQILLRINREAVADHCDGLTLSGGEPFIQPIPSAVILEEAHKVGWNTWTYTGYTYEDLLEMAESDENIDRVLKATDVLVDGPYVEELADINLKYRDSSNQRIIKLVDGRMSEILDYGTWDNES